MFLLSAIKGKCAFCKRTKINLRLDGKAQRARHGGGCGGGGCVSRVSPRANLIKLMSRLSIETCFLALWRARKVRPERSGRTNCSVSPILAGRTSVACRSGLPAVNPGLARLSPMIGLPEPPKAERSYCFHWPPAAQTQSNRVGRQLIAFAQSTGHRVMCACACVLRAIKTRALLYMASRR